MSAGFQETNHFVPWPKIKSFRNIVAHRYFGIDIGELWQIIREDVPKLKENIKNILSNETLTITKTEQNKTLILKYWNSWQKPDWEEMRSSLAGTNFLASQLC